MKWLLLPALLLTPWALSAQAVPAQTTALVGCPSVEGYDAQRQASMSGDPIAWLDALELWGCLQVAPGTAVSVLGVEGREDVLCLQTPLPAESGGWVGCLYADAAQVRRSQ